MRNLRSLVPAAVAAVVLLGLASVLVWPQTESAHSVGPAELSRGPSAIAVGNPRGDVTLVEFFDYQCPICRKVYPEVLALEKQDSRLRIIHKQRPVFGEPSVYAAKIALAAR